MIASGPVLEEESFRSLLDKLRGESAKIVSTESSMRKKAWLRFDALGLPDKSREAYRYIKLRELFSRHYRLSPASSPSFDRILPFVYPECSDSVFVFVNGRYNPLLSRTKALPEKMTFSPSEDALKTFGAFLNNRQAESLKDETDPFSVLNAALHEKGLFLYLPPGTVVDVPVQILHVIDTEERTCLLLPRLQLFAGADSGVDLISVQKTLSGDGCFVNQAEELTLEEGARVSYRQVVCDESPRSWHFDFLRADIKRNGSLKTVCITEGSGTTRHDYAVRLNGENAEALLNGISMLKDKREAHAHIMMDHRAPSCRSFQLFKTVLNDSARSSFEGKIMVRQDAQKTEAFQLNNNLLLGDHSRAESKPNLEIFADDVKASHGATVGRLDVDQLFYLKARGLSDAQAKNLLIYGFCDTVIEMFEPKSLKETLLERAKNYLQADEK